MVLFHLYGNPQIHRFEAPGIAVMAPTKSEARAAIKKHTRRPIPKGLKLVRAK